MVHRSTDDSLDLIATWISNLSPGNMLCKGGKLHQFLTCFDAL